MTARGWSFVYAASVGATIGVVVSLYLGIYRTESVGSVRAAAAQAALAECRAAEAAMLPSCRAVVAALRACTGQVESREYEAAVCRDELRETRETCGVAP